MAVQLPQTNELGFFEIRFESIGGLGAHLAGQLLATAGILKMGLNGAHFSSYGSEKKGSPVKSFVRLCSSDQKMRAGSPVERPHLVAVFHENLMKTENVVRGLMGDGAVIVNTTADAEAIRDRLGLKSGRVAVVDALGIAVEEKTRVNTAILGAVCRLCPFLDKEVVKADIADTFIKKYPALAEANVRTFERGYNEVTILDLGAPCEKSAVPFVRPISPLGYETQPIGGVIVNPGNSVLKDLSPSRQGFVPHYHAEKCIHCAQCDSVCPDMCFVWQEGQDKKGKPAQFLQGINYQYCKGCLKCVEACPVSALTEEREVEGFSDAASKKHAFLSA